MHTEYTPPTEFQLELKRVCKLAWTSGTPKQCADEYRALIERFPQAKLLYPYTKEWDKLGDSWMGPGAPKAGNVMAAPQVLLDLEETQLQEEVERQLAKAKERGWL